jgi:hypothetical protein
MSVITLSSDDLKKLTEEEFKQYEFCLISFEISENIFPPGILKRTFSISPLMDIIEYKPHYNKVYMMLNICKFYFDNKCIYASFKDVNMNEQYNKNINIVWMLNITNAGIVHSANEPNSYNIKAIHIYKYFCPKIYNCLNTSYKKLIDKKIEKIKKNCIELSEDIIKIIINYIDIQEISSDIYYYKVGYD